MTEAVPDGCVASETLSGLPGSPGIAVGPLLLFHPKRPVLFKRRIPEGRTLSERTRFQSAVERASAELKSVLEAARERTGAAELSILDAHLLMLSDPTLASAVEREIASDRKNAEWALTVAVGDMAARLRASRDPYLRERSRDFESVGEMLWRALREDSPESPEPEEPCVVVASDLSPAQTAGFDKQRVIGIVTEVGSRSSHTAILARALDIPAVVGCAGVVERSAKHERTLVFGHSGQVVLSPTEQETSEARAIARRRSVFVSGLRKSRDVPGTTRCGVPVALLANIELPHEAKLAAAQGAQGIGLYRTEFMFMGRATAPTEDEQFQAYRFVLEQMARRPVVLRTFDLGGDKLLSAVPKLQGNQELGMRGIRLALTHPELLRVQFRAMLRAAVFGSLRVMVPMVTVSSELQQVRIQFERARQELEAEQGSPSADVPLGCMIEVPAAALNARHLAEQVDFLSIGTNDLVQYTCAVDRRNTGLSRLASPFDPAVLQLISGTLSGAARAGKPVTVCGAMASDPLAAVLLVGLGVRSLSMEAAAIPTIKEALRRTTLAEASAAASSAASLGSSEAVLELLRRDFESLNDLTWFD